MHPSPTSSPLMTTSCNAGAGRKACEMAARSHSGPHAAPSRPAPDRAAPGTTLLLTRYCSPFSGR